MVTLKDIAEKAGVTDATVSNILRGRYTPTRAAAVRRAERIQAIANELGYRPNTAARATREGRFAAVGVLQAADPGRGHLAANALFAIQSVAAANDLHLSMGLLPDSDLTDPAGLPVVLREWSVDGLIVCYNKNVPPLMEEHIARHNTPVVWLNDKRPHDCVYLDDFGSARGATEILLEHGHRRITFVGNPPPGNHYSVADRYEGYAQVMRQAGLSTDACFLEPCRDPSQSDWETQMSQLAGMLDREDRPTAVITTHHPADLIHVADKMGLSVPEDLSLILIHETVNPTLGVMPTAMRLHTFGLGHLAFMQVQKKIQNPREPLSPLAVYSTFERGQTLGPAPQKVSRPRL